MYKHTHAHTECVCLSGINCLLLWFYFFNEEAAKTCTDAPAAALYGLTGRRVVNLRAPHQIRETNLAT